jgi:pyruvate/2-oxoglutarate dehydrogenase complex dihydrolipoamide dehydrogenase (E3) component
VENYDAIIIGAGQAGVPLATAFAGAGWRTALVEQRYVGGTCINDGCTPTKTMIASAEAAYRARQIEAFGARVGEVSVDLRRVRQRKAGIVESFRNGSQRRLEQAGVHLLMGHASFTGSHTLQVQLAAGGAPLQMTASTIVINTGARPAAPQLAGLSTIPYLDSTSIMELEDVPAHLLVLGGSYVALEFGQMFQRFGSQVTIIERGHQLLPREDPDVAETILGLLREEELEVLLDSAALRVGPGPNGTVRLETRSPRGDRTLTGTHILMATGRTPNTDQVGLSEAGIITDAQGYISVNDRLETNVPGIYALGDVKGGPAFTHIAYDDYRILKANLLEHGQASIRGRLVPYTVFIDPQLGRIGLTEAEARAQNRPIQIAKLPMSYVARAIELGRTRGFIKAIVDQESQLILGAAVLGIEGGEIMSMLQIAMLGKLPYPRLRDGVFAHPTLAELLNNLFAGGLLPG